MLGGYSQAYLTPIGAWYDALPGPGPKWRSLTVDEKMDAIRSYQAKHNDEEPKE